MELYSKMRKMMLLAADHLVEEDHQDLLVADLPGLLVADHLDLLVADLLDLLVVDHQRRVDLLGLLVADHQRRVGLLAEDLRREEDHLAEDLQRKADLLAVDLVDQNVDLLVEDLAVDLLSAVDHRVDQNVDHRNDSIEDYLNPAFFRLSNNTCPNSLGSLAQAIPAASNASNFSSAVPLPPEMIAPA